MSAAVACRPGAVGPGPGENHPRRPTLIVVSDDPPFRAELRCRLSRINATLGLGEASLRRLLLDSALSEADAALLDCRSFTPELASTIQSMAAPAAEAPRAGPPPIIALTRDAAAGHEALAAGAVDYIPESELSQDRLGSAIRCAIRARRHAEEVARLREELERRVRERTADLLRANDDLRRRNAELDQFAHVASHDLQEPLRKVRAFSQLLARDVGGRLPETAAKDLAFITEAAGRMQALVQDLLSLSRADKSALRCEPTPLNRCADAAIEALAGTISEREAEIQSDELPAVDGDASLLTQLYQNLIANAVKFVPRARRPVVRLTAERTDRGWVLGVQDNGIGVPPESSAEIFEPFKRLHGRDDYPGAGIGLAICRKAVERHGGRIWIEHTANGGAHFKFTLGQIAGVQSCPSQAARRPSSR